MASKKTPPNPSDTQEGSPVETAAVDPKPQTEAGADAVASLIDAEATTKAADKKRPYRVLSPLNHDQEDYAIGDTVGLTDAQAEPLLAVRAVTGVGV